MHGRAYSIAILVTYCAAMFFQACSNSKNTVATRSFHNVTARYNVVFEAKESYRKGIENIEKNYNANYTEMLPVYKIDDEQSFELASSFMDVCVEECGKNILKHSIVSKPKKKYSRYGMSGSDEAFYNKPEYCKWIDDTYLLMGKANYVTRDYDRAESAFQLGVSRFKLEPTKFEAQLWLAKTFWAEKNYNEALELLEKLNKDKRHPKKLDVDIHKVYAQIYITTNRYQAAIDELNETLTLIKKRKKNSRAWLLYILGDLNRLAGNYPESKKCYEQIIKLNPDYPMVFNSKINLATVFTPGSNTEYIRQQLEKLLKDERNKDYLDRIYYGLAEIDRKNNDLNSALLNYRKSARYSFNDDIQKAKSYLAAADIYFFKGEYLRAGEFYDSTMQYLPKSYSAYNEISLKAQNLSLLVKYIRQAERQDSLIRVANMTPNERKRVIAKIIDDVINQEEAEKIAKTNPYYQSSSDNNFGVEYTGQDGNPNFQGKWYLYNVTALNYGRQEFLKKWGTRKLEDNWRRKNKSVTTDSEAQEEDSKSENQDVQDNKNPEYYMKDLPLTDSAMKVCLNKEADAWFSVSDVYADKIGDIDKAIETLLNLNEKYPNHYLKAQAYYRLYKLYGQKGEFQLAQHVKAMLDSEFPQSGYSKILNDPNYEKNLALRKQRAEDLYNRAIEEFYAENFENAAAICEEGQKEYSDLQIAENFIYIQARCFGRVKKTDLMKQKLEYLLEKYPSTGLKEYAQDKLKALEGGEFETSKFSFHEDKKHLFFLVMKKNNPKLSEMNFKILNFCATNGYSQLEVATKDFSSCKMFYVFDFENKAAAEVFLEKFKKENSQEILPEDDFRIVTVSSENFDLITEDADIEAYYNFYLK